MRNPSIFPTMSSDHQMRLLKVFLPRELKVRDHNVFAIAPKNDVLLLPAHFI
jgi:hypothetical protein